MGGFFRRSSPAPAPAPAPAAASAAARPVGEEVEAMVETDAGKMGRRRKGKKALVIKSGSANVGGEGGSGLNIPVS
jgi:hypothetical protein